MENATAETVLVLDCGHPPSLHSTYTTGFGTTPDGRKLCNECCAELDREAARRGEPLMAYLANPDKPVVTTWPGIVLGHVFGIRTFKRMTPTGAPYTDVRFRVTIEDRVYYGRGPGFGLYCRLRPLKRT